MAPVKETEFWKFADAETRLDQYAAHFRGTGGEHAVGEYSVRYLSLADVPARVRRFLPQARLVVSLRNPVDQVYSNYWHLQRQNFHLHDPRQAPCSLTEAVEKYPDLLFSPARYANHLHHWLAQFPREQLHVILFDDIESRPADVLRRLFSFLDVDPEFVPPSLFATGSAVRGGTSSRSEQAARWHAGMYDQLVKRIYTPMKRALGSRRAAQIKDTLRIHWLMERIFRQQGYPPMPPETRALLAEEFRPEIDQLEKLTGLELDAWK